VHSANIQRSCVYHILCAKIMCISHIIIHMITCVLCTHVYHIIMCISRIIHMIVYYMWYTHYIHMCVLCTHAHHMCTRVLCVYTCDVYCHLILLLLLLSLYSLNSTPKPRMYLDPCPRYRWSDGYMYSLLHLECHLPSISNLNLLGLFPTERGNRELEN